MIYIYRRPNQVMYIIPFKIFINNDSWLLIGNGEEVTFNLEEGHYTIQTKAEMYFGKTNQLSFEYDGKSDIYFLQYYNFRSKYFFFNQFEEDRKYRPVLKQVSKEEYNAVKNIVHIRQPSLPDNTFTRSLPKIDLFLSLMILLFSLYVWNVLSLQDLPTSSFFIFGIICCIMVIAHWGSTTYKNMVVRGRYLWTNCISLFFLMFFFYEYLWVELFLVASFLAYLILYLKIRKIREYS